jgi:glycosyltransferase involved in cell wall biosynthesis
VLTLHGIRFLEVALWEGFLERVYRGWFIKRIEKRAVKRAEHIISISPFIRSTFEEQIRGKIYDIENPIDDAYFQVPQRATAAQLLFVGRLIPRKGVHTLLRAFAFLHHRMPKATLRIAGGKVFANESRTYPKELKEFITKAGLQEAVTFIGEQDKSAIMEEYSKCAAFVLSSVLETAPMVIMEAMAAGKAVISTDAGGARYLVEHGQTGLIVPPEDERALGNALYEILSNENRLEAMGRQAKKVAKQRFHAAAIARQTREVYYSMKGKRPPS